MYGSYGYEPICGLYYNVPYFGRIQQAYLPQVEVKVHASILATTSRTTLKQTFVNPSASRGIREVRYAFPLYDGVSVVGFSCQVGNRTITGEVREKQEAKEVYSDAVARGETAGLLEQLPEASDVFTTTIGNIPPGARVVVNVTYLGELKHDMGVDGTRFTIPTRICPRYGTVNGGHFDSVQQMNGTISITVDAEMAEGSLIQKLQSPSHPISMSTGTTSVEPDAAPSMSKVSATLSLGVAHLDTDFVLQVIAKETGVPKAILETHSTIPNHRALMTTLVPKFALPTEKPEIVFVCDQSGSMGGSRMDLAIEALQVFLKSLPVGVKFNICSFGSRHSFLWPRSVTYSQDTLDHAVRHTRSISANYGGTEMLAPLKATIENRYSDMPLDIMLLTDGEIWNQQLLFDELNYHIQEKKAPIRVFTLGIGSGVSHSLIEGIAKAGNGFAQTVQEGEKMSSKVVRMLKGALSPHVNDYTLEVKYASGEEEDGFELVEKVTDSLRVNLDLKDKRNVPKPKKSQNPISLFDTSADLDVPAATSKDRYAHLPIVPAPKILQAPQSIPPLFAFNRTTVYLLLSPSAPRATPTSVILRGTSAHGPLELEIPIQTLDAPGETIHQLAAKKAVYELEQGRGWLAEARDREGELLKKRFEGRFSDMVEHEAVKLGVQFQVGGKWCLFVATEKKEKEGRETMEEDWEFLEDVQGAQQEQEQEQQHMANARVFAQQQRAQQQRAQQQQAQQQQFIPQGLQASPVRSPRSFPYGSAGSFSPLQTHDNSDSGGFSTFSAKPAVSTSSSGGGPFGGALSTMKTATLYGQSSTSASSNPFARGFGASNPKVQPVAASLFGSGSVSTTAYAGGSLFGTAASASVPISASHASALQDYQMQTMLLEQQNKKRLHMRQKPTTAEQTRTNKLKRAAFECERPVGDGSDAVLENSDFDAFLHTDKSSTQRAVKRVAAKKKRSQPLQRNQLIDVPQSGGIEEIEEQPKMPTSPSYSPHNHGHTTCSPLPESTSPPLDAPSPDYTPYSPGYRSPGTTEPQSPGYSPASPRYSPASPSPYSPSCAVDPQSPQSPQYAAASPSYGPGLIDFSPLTPLSSEAMLKRLVAHQSFSGAFPYTVDILAVLGVDVQAFEKSMEEQEWHDASADRDPLMTALVIIHVESKLKGLRDEWELVIEKARIWLQSRERAAAVYLEVAEKLVQGE